MKKLIIYLAILFGLFHNAIQVHAQTDTASARLGNRLGPIVNKKIDSVLKVLQTQKEDTSKLNTLDWLCMMYYPNLDSKNIYRYATIELALAIKLNSEKDKGLAYKNLGLSYYFQRNYIEATKNYLTAIQISKSVDEKRDVALASTFLGNAYSGQRKYAEAIKITLEAIAIYQELKIERNLAICCLFTGGYYGMLGDYEQALKYYYLSLQSFERSGDDYWGHEVYCIYIASCYSGIGNIYTGQDRYDEALKSFQLALKFQTESGVKQSIAHLNNSIGEAYFLKGDYERALEAHFSALEFLKKYNTAVMNRSTFASTYINIGNVYRKKGELARIENKKQSMEESFSEASKYYYLSLELYEAMEFEMGIAGANIDLGNINMSMNNLNRARVFLLKGLELAETSGAKEYVKQGYISLSQLDSMQGNYKSAFEHYKLYVAARDSLVNQESIQKSEGYKMQYEVEKREDQIKLLTTENQLKTALASKENQRKNFAYISIAVLALMGGYGFYRYRRRKRIQSQQSLMKERLRISRELHDEVGATLSGIAMYSHLAKEQIKNQQSTEIEKSLNIMQQSSGEMVNKLNDIVWLINPDQDSLQKLVQRLEEYARDMAAIKNMQVKVTVPERIAGINLPMENRRNIYLFCKEAINNAVKYSNGSLLELRINEKDGKIEFSVSDNGKGFDAVMVRRGNGLENMQKRADEIGATLVLQSKMNEGVMVSMQVRNS